MTKTIDIHGYTVEEARRYIERTIVKLDKNVTELVVIHGYHGGDKLKELLRSPNGIRSRRINRRKYTSNQGETILELCE
ncbi:Smr domain protein [Candidatus Izimaplasma bacterium HR1]|jgi:hypothetical protein|uniref:Smr/MutS family protein n=1 Tax=Candidatus Izimoplasma sp. HR1 TaxID=1541959 RepID=UPI0004F869DE|nr:Smr domain protein [Candidatus Izimaplasma bacterium HR1]